MKDILKLGGILMLTTAIAATGLAAVYSVTKPMILEQKRLAIENALTIALPTANKEAIEPVEFDGKIAYYKGFSDNDKSTLVGYAFIAYGPAYSSTIETMVGVDNEGQILGMKVLAQTETPGLGTKVEQIKYGESSPWFTDQFLNKAAYSVAVEKDGGEINSITGATISSRAVAKSVVAGYENFQKIVK